MSLKIPFRNLYLKNEQGSVAVEFALISMFFLISICGLLEAGRVFWTLNTLQYAGEATARYYLTNKGASDSDLVTYLQDKVEEAQIRAENLSVVINKTTVSDVNFVQLDLSYKYYILGSLMPATLNGVTLTATTRLPVP